MIIKGQRPERGKSGAVLNTATVSGLKLQGYIDDRVLVNGAVISDGEPVSILSTSANFKQGLYVDIQIWPPELPVDKRTNDNLLTWQEVMVFPYWDTFVDNGDRDPDYIWPDGSALTSGQTNAEVEFGKPIRASDNATISFWRALQNRDGASHIYWTYFSYKYLIL